MHFLILQTPCYPVLNKPEGLLKFKKINQMKKIHITLLMLCFAAGLQAQIVARPPRGGNYKPVLNKNIVTSFLGEREKLQLLQNSPGKPGGMSNATSLGAKSTIGICTSDNPAMTSKARNVNEVTKNFINIGEDGWLCLEIGGVEKGYYAIEVNLLEGGGIDEFYVAPSSTPFVFKTELITIKRSNNKLVFMKELQSGVVNYISIFTTNTSILSSFTFSNAQVSKVNL